MIFIDYPLKYAQPVFLQYFIIYRLYIATGINKFRNTASNGLFVID